MAFKSARQRRAFFARGGYSKKAIYLTSQEKTYAKKEGIIPEKMRERKAAARFLGADKPYKG